MVYNRRARYTDEIAQEIKIMSKETIKLWFWDKNFTKEEKYAISCGVLSLEVIKETENAKCFQWKTEFGTITKWIPKSCIVVVEK